jgi:predicted SprT family Zn-dependent metalloprotease
MKAADQGLKRMSVDQLREEWARLNDRYFGGTLPVIHIEWSRRLTASAGMFLSRIGPRARTDSLTAVRGPRRLIRLSLPLLRNEPYEEVSGTLAHEMIHQWQYDVLRRRPNHGAEFRDMMAAMNRDGLGITVRHSLDGAVQALARYAWRCQECGRDYHRQRRTIQPKYHRCGDCHGRLSELPLQRVNARSPSRRGASDGANVDAALPRRVVSAQLALPFEEAVYCTRPPEVLFSHVISPARPRPAETGSSPVDAPLADYTRPPQALFPPARPDRAETRSFPKDAPFP